LGNSLPDQPIKACNWCGQDCREEGVGGTVEVGKNYQGPTVWKGTQSLIRSHMSHLSW